MRGKRLGKRRRREIRGLLMQGCTEMAITKVKNNKEERMVYGICARQQGMEEGGRERNGMIDRRLRERREELLGPRHCRDKPAKPGSGLVNVRWREEVVESRHGSPPPVSPQSTPRSWPAFGKQRP